MNGHLAVQNILASDTAYKALVGGTTARIYYDQAVETAVLPFAIVRLDGSDPTDDKDGPSTMDHDFVYVTHFAALATDAAAMAEAGRDALDRQSGTYHGVVVQSVQFLTQRSDSEFLVDKKVRTIEQMYKIITTQ
jgi:hypothetical protein